MEQNCRDPSRIARDLASVLPRYITNLKEGASRKHFRKYAPNAPHVDSLAVVCRVAQKLRGPIPPGHHILRQFVLVLQFDASCETKVADGEIAICVYQQVRWFHISMQDVGGVDKLKSP